VQLKEFSVTKHFILPDTQVKPGVNTDHLEAAGNWCVEKQPDTIINLGDFWDMPSLSHYDAGTLKNEGARYVDDIAAGRAAMDRFLRPIHELQSRQRTNKKRVYDPRLVFLCGNHEYRIERAINKDPKYAGVLSYSDFGLREDGWEFHPYQSPVEIDGILYAHNFVNMESLKKTVIGGTIENKMRKIGQSFCMGHQQCYQVGYHQYNTGRVIRGIVAGAFYTHHEDYMGHQGNNHWRGCLQLNEVHNGNYGLLELSVDYLLKEYI
jgi:hypothetical protein